MRVSAGDSLRYPWYLRNDEVGPINVKEVVRIGEWLDIKAAHDPEVPVWFQGGWMHEVNVRDPLVNRQYGLETAEKVVDKNFCGTACCVAGYVAWEYVVPNGRHALSNSVRKPFVTPDGTRIDPCANEERDYRHVAFAAQAILGITDSEANVLFTGSNSADEIKFYLNAFLEVRGESVRI